MQMMRHIQQLNDAQNDAQNEGTEKEGTEKEAHTHLHLSMEKIEKSGCRLVSGWGMMKYRSMSKRVRKRLTIKVDN